MASVSADIIYKKYLTAVNTYYIHKKCEADRLPHRSVIKQGHGHRLKYSPGCQEVRPGFLRLSILNLCSEADFFEGYSAK